MKNLDAAADAQMNHADAAMPEGQSLTGRRVLVVEDEMVISMFIEDVLQGLGCTVVGPAWRTQQALELLEGHAIDAAVLDLNLGRDGDSYPIADVLMQRGLPFVFSTGYGRQGLLPAYRDVPCLTKPFAEKALAQALAALFIRG